ncbi:ArsI/CadI family heavy metal resistance metalloenzyme [methanotrophic endosymbiont of Bathymodiolus puteoserpentis (Logatchev)]|jgi:catechol 2,3-dioxygenase-like lactoylglutathione lyase family enzyme|uniref:ArsI/CadI family heavy metal resistance metalloenzyme n=1 Tax=methanotrophic endosymbiont of Bathymodiolus puteoserpentis (Logatchev) TaxID=343235 RepID=UPI0013C89037|nr:ArsI/CadI family heavy metal resistance metalloenzyme [methanotrophic endosymbiont of Bathymodiolus puteoserpentis (Logatchev)]SHE23028.1 Lactoylglutathione lyase @ Cadmium-induced protein CadI [methanotrophic endosymbiont of Bathymodiolus puteoserpentis (Logatchev)]
MKRLHIHLAVENLEQNINFYSTMFGCQPTVQHDDYAKWMLDDPRINFAISNRSKKLGLDHLGIQADDESELQAIKQQLDATQVPIEAQEGAACCYARSDKYWVTDPQGIAWESFHSLNEIPTFNESKDGVDEESNACRPALEGEKKVSCCG